MFQEFETGRFVFKCRHCKKKYLYDGVTGYHKAHFHFHSLVMGLPIEEPLIGRAPRLTEVHWCNTETGQKGIAEMVGIIGENPIVK